MNEVVELGWVGDSLLQRRWVHVGVFFILLDFLVRGARQHCLLTLKQYTRVRVRVEIVGAIV